MRTGVVAGKVAARFGGRRVEKLCKGLSPDDSESVSRRRRIAAVPHFLFREDSFIRNATFGAKSLRVNPFAWSPVVRIHS
jgi:hypothetical protein